MSLHACLSLWPPARQDDPGSVPVCLHPDTLLVSIFSVDRREKSCVLRQARAWWDCPSVFPTVHGRTSYVFSSCVNPHISLPNLCLFTHAGKQLHLYLRVLVSGSQLAEETHRVRNRLI